MWTTSNVLKNHWFLPNTNHILRPSIWAWETITHNFTQREREREREKNHWLTCDYVTSGITYYSYCKTLLFYQVKTDTLQVCWNVISSKRPFLSTYSLLSYTLSSQTYHPADFIHGAHHHLILACEFFSLSLGCKFLKGTGICWLIYPNIESTLAQCFKITGI